MNPVPTTILYVASSSLERLDGRISSEGLNMYNDLLLNRLVAPVDTEDEQVQDLITEIEELDSLLSPEAQDLIRDLRPYIVTDDVYEEMDEQASFGDRVADRMSS